MEVLLLLQFFAVGGAIWIAGRWSIFSTTTRVFNPAPKLFTIAIPTAIP
jgi:hypothetical protein